MTLNLLIAVSLMRFTHRWVVHAGAGWLQTFGEPSAHLLSGTLPTKNNINTDTSLSKLREVVKGREAWRATGLGVTKRRTRRSG